MAGTFVALGSCSKYPFERMLRAVAEVCDVLPQPIVVQTAGAMVQLPAWIKAIEFLSHEQYQHLLETSDLVICHVGAGTVLSAIRANAQVVAMVRKADLGEVADDHQFEFAEALSKMGLISIAANANDLRRLSLTSSLPQNHESISTSPARLIEYIDQEIKRLCATGRKPKIALVASSGGHLTELRDLRKAYENYQHFFVVSKDVGASVDMKNNFHLLRANERDWKLPFLAVSAFRLLLNKRPQIIISTGSGSALPIIIIGKILFGVRVIFVESITRVKTASPAARVAYCLSDSFVYRWSELRRFFPKGKLIAMTTWRSPTDAMCVRQGQLSADEPASNEASA